MKFQSKKASKNVLVEEDPEDKLILESIPRKLDSLESLAP